MSPTKTSATKARVSAAASSKATALANQQPEPRGRTSGSSVALAPPSPSPEQVALERHAAARQRLADHVATVHRNLATEIGAARQRLADLQAKAWKLGLERRRLIERIAEIDLDLREAEKAEKIEEGAIEAYVRAQARVQPPPDLA
ncbi:MAG: hypothetical protein KGR26_10765 [Cyanobacteria bacterium REEB65]|nr:hypothetical protein [Cyanobacteria bacterium REEB65]